MYTIEEKNFKKYLEEYEKLGVKQTEPARAQKLALANKYLRVTDNPNKCVEFGDIIDALVTNVIDLKETVAAQQETIQKLEEMRGWLASKELQQSLVARVTALEKSAKRRRAA